MGAPKGHKPYNTKGEGGRPKWKWTDGNIENLAENLEKWVQDKIDNKEFFWWKDWCFDVGILPEFCAEFASKNKRFAVAYKSAKSYQESQVSKGALVKKFSENFSKFYLQTQHRENWTPPSDVAENGANLVSLLKLYREGKLTGDDIGKLIGDVVKQADDVQKSS